MTSLPVALDAHVPPLDHLVALVEVIDRSSLDDERLPGPIGTDAPDPPVPLLVRVVCSGHGPDDPVELGFLPLDGHPFDHLIGLVAPDDWWAVGVVAHGRARSWPDPGAPTAQGPGRSPAPSRRARTTHLVARTGDAASVLRIGDDEPLTQRHPETERTGTLGAIDDGLRRVLGLPSAPPPPTTAELWAVCWLDEVRTALRRGVLDGSHWPSVATRHPLFTLVAELGDGADLAAHGRVREWAIEHLDRAGRHFAHRVSWARLLADERVRDRPVHLDRESLAWMDEGLFARELLASLEHPGELLDEVAPGLSGPVVSRVRTTLQRWHVLLART